MAWNILSYLDARCHLRNNNVEAMNRESCAQWWKYAKREGGLALIIVLLIVTILAGLILDFGYTSRVDLALSGLNRDVIKARTLLESGYHMGCVLLKNDTNGYDSLNDIWAKPDILHLGTQLIKEEGYVGGSIIDENSKFNLNTLIDEQGGVNESAYDQFLRLLHLLRLEPFLANALLDWMDSDDRALPGGAEQNFYASLGRVCKNAPLDSLRELLLIRGFKPELLWGNKAQEGLLPYVTVHSEGKININTTSKLVLRSLDEELDEQLAISIIDYRKDKPFESTNDLKKVPGINAKLFARILSRITVSSSYFLITLEGTVGEATCRLTTVVHRQASKVRPLYWRWF
jgi:general secretion pathway protein K